MDNDQDYKNGFPEIDVNKESILRMLTKVASFKMEERDLALDRFKRSNENMEDDEFWLHGKTAILWLESATKSSNYLGDMAKDMMKLVFKEENPEGGAAATIGMSDEDKKRMAMVAENFLRDRRKGDEERKGGAHKEIGEGQEKKESTEE